MINKQSLWFVTLFSLILILGVYYVSIPQDTLTTFSGNMTDNSSSLEVNSSSIIVAMKVEEEEKLLAAMEDAQQILLDNTANVEEKNAAYEVLQTLNTQKGKILAIEKLIKENYDLESCTKIDGNKISITIASEDQGKKIANEIIQKVQGLYDTPMYITIKFQK